MDVIQEMLLKKMDYYTYSTQQITKLKMVEYQSKL